MTNLMSNRYGAFQPRSVSRRGGLRESALWVGLVAATLLLPLSGCAVRDLVKGTSRIEVKHAAHSQAKSKVQLVDVALARSSKAGEASVFQLTLRNTQKEGLGARLLTTSPESGQSCEDVYMLQPLAAAVVHCAQRLETNGPFSLELTVYDDLGNTHIVERARLSASFGPDGVAQLEWE
jgi:hypothetical protein